MPFSYISFLNYCNKLLKQQSLITYSELIPKFKLNNDELDNLINELSASNLVYKISDNSFSTTYKGQHVLYSFIMEWLFKYVISIIALIISVFALVVSIFK